MLRTIFITALFAAATLASAACGSGSATSPSSDDGGGGTDASNVDAEGRGADADADADAAVDGPVDVAAHDAGYTSDGPPAEASGDVSNEASDDASAEATADAPTDTSASEAASSDSGVSETGTVVCPTVPTSATVGSYTSALPALTWWGGGYTVIIDQTPTAGQSFELAYQKTDATGALLAGPTPLLPPDGISRFWPRVAFSGSQYGIVFLQDLTIRRPTFLRTDANLAPIAGSTVQLGSNGATFQSVGVAWSESMSMWGVAWSEGDAASNTTYLQRFDPSGNPVGGPISLGPGYVSDNGNPIVATGEGWAVVVTGSPVTVYEVSSEGNVRPIALPFDGLRASIATDGTQYAVVADYHNPSGFEGSSMFAEVEIGGGVLPSSVAAMGGTAASLPNVVWTGTTFVAVWSDTDASHPLALLTASIPTNSTASSIGGGMFSAQSNAGFNALAAGSCGWAVVYELFTAGSLAYLDVEP